jgi:poly-gamma-glutamate capsule biosynthesis protein CapA/YwtB (metallophosphatase superfamily)
MKKVYSIILIVAVIFIIILAAFPYKSREAKILFVGDMSFDRYIREVSYAKGGEFVFSCIDNFLKDSDLVVGNLEGPITENASRSMFTVPGSDDNFVFTFPTNTARLLAENNVKLVNLGNNHMLNFSRDGLLQTKKFLTQAGVKYFGDPDAVENEKVARMNLGGVPVSFVSWSDFNSDSTDITAAQIKKEAESGRKVIVYAHWGDEYLPPPDRVKKLAHSFVDAGAGLIVGSHPHIIQVSETYKGKQIYYSLGNFIFDQYWNKEVSTGLVLEVDISNEKIKTVEHKVSLNRDGRTCLAD